MSINFSKKNISSSHYFPTPQHRFHHRFSVPEQISLGGTTGQFERSHPFTTLFCAKKIKLQSHTFPTKKESSESEEYEDLYEVKKESVPSVPNLFLEQIWNRNGTDLEQILFSLSLFGLASP